MTSETTVYIGRKPPMNYVIAVVTRFSSGSREVTVKARRKNISLAVDVAEIVRNRFVPEARVRSVEIGTEQLSGEDGRTANVSNIAISLSKEDGAEP